MFAMQFGIAKKSRVHAGQRDEILKQPDAGGLGGHSAEKLISRFGPRRSSTSTGRNALGGRGHGVKPRTAAEGLVEGGAEMAEAGIADL